VNELARTQAAAAPSGAQASMQSAVQEIASVCVMGLGYIGLPTAAIIASRGMRVYGVDVRQDVVDLIAKGLIPISEPDLDGLVQKVVRDGGLRVATAPTEADVFILAVPTPISQDKAPVLDMVFAAVRAIAPVLRVGNLVILESTSPVGTTEQVSELLAELRPDLALPTRKGAANINIAYCPERVLPGRILAELVDNARCVGGVTSACAKRTQHFYKRFVRGPCLVTTARTAELVKLAENAYRDVNIAFANELSMICDDLSVDIWDVIDLANRHPRVNILRPGPGVGGHCIAVDPWFIVHSAPERAQIIRAAREVNDRKTHHVLARAEALIGEYPYANVACLGLAFKANVDDLRESPALEIAKTLADKHGARIRIVEPYLRALPGPFAGTGATLVDLAGALASCEIAIVLVDHDEFKGISTSERRHLEVLDSRGIWRERRLQP
jgi:UDP-N-acetyl-D-mannosaminuronic acid dehydrogenase